MNASSSAEALGQKAAVNFQRQANEWLVALRAQAVRAGILPVSCGGANLDVLDCLRSELKRENGTVLADWDWLRQQIAGQREEIVLDPARSMRLSPALHLLSGTAPIRMQRVPHYVRIWKQCRTVLWHWKRRLAQVNRCRQVPRFDADVILSLVRSTGHVFDMLPVAHRLRDEYHLHTVFATADVAQDIAVNNARFSAVPLCHVAMHRNARAAARILHRLTGLLARDESELPDYDPGERLLLVAVTLRVLREHMAYVLAVAEGASRLISQVRPKAIVIGNPCTIEGRVACYIGKAAGIPTVALEHGSIFPDDPNWQECPVDLVCVWGEVSRRALEKVGLHPSRIAVTGAPRYDCLFRTEPIRSAQSERVILVATSGPGDHVTLDQHLSFIRLLYAAADLVPEVRWVVKLHMKDRRGHYLAATHSQPGNVTLATSMRADDGLAIFDYLHQATALVTVASTAAVDAIAVGVPVVAVDIWSNGEGLRGVEFLDRGCTARVRTSVELAQEVRRLCQSNRDLQSAGATQAYLNDHFAHRGTAANEVAKRVSQCVAHS